MFLISISCASARNELQVAADAAVVSERHDDVALVDVAIERERGVLGQLEKRAQIRPDTGVWLDPITRRWSSLAENAGVTPLRQQRAPLDCNAPTSETPSHLLRDGAGSQVVRPTPRIVAARIAHPPLATGARSAQQMSPDWPTAHCPHRPSS